LPVTYADSVIIAEQQPWTHNSVSVSLRQKRTYQHLSTTVADIKSLQGPDILDDRHKGVKVVRVSSHFAIKYGLLVDFIEGENMVFVRESTNIRVPTLYAMFTEVSSDMKFIVMEYIPGKTLLSCWEALDHGQKQLISTQLRHCCK